MRLYKNGNIIFFKTGLRNVSLKLISLFKKSINYQTNIVHHIIIFIEDTKKEKAKLYYLKGKTLDFLPTYEKTAEDYLNKSVYNSSNSLVKAQPCQWGLLEQFGACFVQKKRFIRISKGCRDGFGKCKYKFISRKGKTRSVLGISQLFSEIRAPT